MNIRQKERFFLFTHAITILSLFTYSVYDEKVKKFFVTEFFSQKLTKINDNERIEF